MLRTLFSATILAGALAGSAMAQAPDAGCALPSEPKGIPAAIDRPKNRFGQEGRAFTHLAYRRMSPAGIEPTFKV